MLSTYFSYFKRGMHEIALKIFGSQRKYFVGYAPALVGVGVLTALWHVRCNLCFFLPGSLSQSPSPDIRTENFAVWNR